MLIDSYQATLMDVVVVVVVIVLSNSLRLRKAEKFGCFGSIAKYHHTRSVD
jgi:hypothetical protein